MVLEQSTTFIIRMSGLKTIRAGSNLRHKVGVWINGDLSWIDNPLNPPGEWTFEFQYPHDALIGHTKAKNERLGYYFGI
jgi:hypothetical protein